MQHPRIFSRGHIGRGWTNIAVLYGRSQEYVTLIYPLVVVNHALMWSKVGTYRSGAHHPREALSKEQIVQDREHPTLFVRDTSVGDTPSWDQPCRAPAPLSSAGIFKQSIGVMNQVGIGLSYRPARLHRLAELIPWNWFLGSLNV